MGLWLYIFGLVPVRGRWYLAGTRCAQHQSLLGAGAPTNASLCECTDPCTAAGERASLPRRAVRARYRCIADASKPLCLIGQPCISVLFTGREVHTSLHTSIHTSLQTSLHPSPISLHPSVPARLSSPLPVRQFSPIGERGLRDGELKGGLTASRIHITTSRNLPSPIQHRVIKRSHYRHYPSPPPPTSIAAHLASPKSPTFRPRVRHPPPHSLSLSHAVPTRYKTGIARTTEAVVLRRGPGAGEPFRPVPAPGVPHYPGCPPGLGQTGLIPPGLGLGTGARRRREGGYTRSRNPPEGGG
jgi:hypothetical protein